jgi:uncharacterized protein YgbK (DUF1537 family)
MAQVAIVADDLTGALDTAARWTHFGLRTMVMLTIAPLPATQAVAVHTASRAATAEQAYCRAKQAAQRLHGRPVYKKMDSTLRGNIGAEIEGLLDGLGLQRALIAPAFPAAGRTVQGGILHVHGVPLAETEFGRDSQWPAQESHVATIVARQTQRTVGNLPLELVRQGEEAIRRALLDCPAQLIVADAVETEHLCALARAATHMPQRWLCCGSAGLADGWLEALELGRIPGESACWAPEAGPVLVAAGSRHPTTAHQLHEAQKDRGLYLVCLTLDEEKAAVEWSQATSVLAKGRCVALSTTFSPYRPGGEADAAAHLAQATACVCASAQILGLILTGGDTADAVCRAMGMTGLQVVGEVEPGIPAAIGVGGQGDNLRLVSKAGGFGDELAIVHSIDYIQGRLESSASHS